MPAWRTPSTIGLCSARDRLRSAEEVAADTMRRSGAAFTLVRGWFKDTLPTLDVDGIAVLRLDGDLYDSTLGSLEALFPRVVSGGLVIIDDYGDWDGCPPRRARLPLVGQGNGDDPPDPLRGDVSEATLTGTRTPGPQTGG